MVEVKIKQSITRKHLKKNNYKRVPADAQFFRHIDEDINGKIRVKKFIHDFVEEVQFRESFLNLKICLLMKLNLSSYYYPALILSERLPLTLVSGEKSVRLKSLNASRQSVSCGV